MIHPDPSAAAAKAVVNRIADAAENSNDFVTEGSISVFKAHKSYGIIGIVSTVLGIGAAFIPDLIAGLVLMAIFGGLGVMIILYGFVMRLTFDPEKLTYRGPFGQTKEIFWRDVQNISTVSEQGDLLIVSPYARIRIFAYLAGFKEIRKLLRRRFPFEAAAEMPTVLE